MQPTDLDLIRHAQRGDAKAFHALVDRHARPMFGLAYSLLGNASDAEDVLQETFAGAFKSLGSFEARSTVKTWLSRILMNQVARQRRQRGPLRMQPIESAAENDANFATRTAVAGVDARLDLATALAALSDEHREVLILRELQQLSYDEMAQVLGLPRGTIESRLHRARAALKAKLGPD